MKKSISILAICFTAWSLSAQTENTKFISAMEKTLAGMDTAQTAEQWIAVSNSIERIAMKETKEWLPSYYVALSQVMAFNLSKDPSNNELYAEKAEEFIDKADALNPDDSEIYVMKSMISGLFIRLNPMVNGQKYGPIAQEQIDKALKLNPENPRAYMHQGITLYFTPEQWGGDKVKGKEMLEAAALKFASFAPKSSIHPDWGREMNEMFLK